MEKAPLISWIRHNKKEFIALVIILVVALSLRLYRIGDFLTFLGDEGRDVRIVRDLLHGNLVFIGPQTSVGNMYLGPLYYYLIAPSLLLSNLNPVGPAIFNAFLGALIIALTWYVGRKWFGPVAGIISALVFALSPVAIIYSRSSWNPNPMPLFALLCVWGIYQVWQNRRYPYLLLVGISYAFALQMHYLGLLLFPVLGLFWLLSFAKDREFLKYSLLAVASFFFLMSPLLLFDLKHNFMNLNALKALLISSSALSLDPTVSNNVFSVALLTVRELVMSRQNLALPLVLILLILLTVGLVFKNRKQYPLYLLIIWLMFAFVGLSFYKNEIYAHYLGFIYPAIYLLLGVIIATLITKTVITRVFAGSILALIVSLSLIFSPVYSQPSGQLYRTQEITDLIIKESNGQPFNFALIAKRNYDESYRYFLENKKSLMVRGEDGVVDQLFVVCEDGDACQPLGNPQYQIAVFGIAKTEQEWNIDGVRIYKLVHTK